MDPVALATGSVVLGVVLVLIYVRTGADGRKRRRRLRRAYDGEDDAVRLAQRKGFVVLERQAVAHYTLRVDGRPRQFSVRADLRLRRGFRKYVAEVKTGDLAPRLQHGPTRRQLLEYGRAFSVRSVLLFDMEREVIHELRVHPGASPLRWVLVLTLGCALGALGARFWP